MIVSKFGWNVLIKHLPLRTLALFVQVQPTQASHGKVARHRYKKSLFSSLSYTPATYERKTKFISIIQSIHSVTLPAGNRSATHKFQLS